MKKLLAVIPLLFALVMAAGAQTVPTTPNIGLYIPYHGTANWDTYMNSNSTALDSYLSGGTLLPRLNLGQLLLQQYMDYTGLGSPPANPASGICRTYFDLGSGQWKGINSTGASCSPIGNAAGTTGHIGYYASNGTVISPSLCTVDVSGNLICASLASNGVGTGKIDFPLGTSPGNPAGGYCRLYGDSGSGTFLAINSSGGSCLPVAPVTSVFTRTGAVTANTGDYTVSQITGAAPLASPTFTGTPAAPTAAPGTSTTQLASTAFVATSFAPLASPTFTGTVTVPKVTTTANCSAIGTSANPSLVACSAAAAGSFSCAVAASTGTCVISTTAVTANSEILITQRTDTTTGTRLSVTCNTGVSTVLPVVTAVTAATSFTINLGTIAANPECFSYHIVN